MTSYNPLADNVINLGAAVGTNMKRSAVSATSVNAFSTTFDGINETCLAGSAITSDRLDPFSISLQAKRGSTGFRAMFNNTLSGGRGILYFVRGSAGANIRLDIGNSTINTIQVETQGSFLAADSWVHLVATYDGSSSAAGVTHYRDAAAVLMTTAADTLTLTTVSTAVAEVGARASNSDAFWNGNLDEVVFWDKELTGAEVTELWGGGTPIDPTTHSASANAIHWWQMGDPGTAEFPTIVDRIGSNNLAMTNMASGNIVADVL
jgi:hypothetical protein